MPHPHVVLFDLFAGGHHGQYMRQLLAYWAEQELPGRLDLVVPPSFLEVHADLPPLLRRHAGAGINLVLVREPVTVHTGGMAGLLRNDLAYGRRLRTYLEQLRPDFCLTYLDHVQLSLGVDLRFGFPVRIAGIYFRPSFHYAALQGRPPSFTEKVQNLRKLLFLRRALRNPHFDTLFCPDPFAVPYLQRQARSARAVFLPDGVEQGGRAVPPEETRRRLGVEPGRRLLLLFGALHRRKGLFVLLEALALLPPELTSPLCLALVGAVAAEEREELHRELASLRARRPLQILLRDTFVAEDEVQDLVAAADLVLLPYQHHVGSSGVLVRAAAGQVPVLGPDYGILGLYIQTRRLGLAVDTTRPETLAEGLRACLSRPPAIPFDAAEAARFAREHTADRFAETIFRHLGMPERRDEGSHP